MWSDLPQGSLINVEEQKWIKHSLHNEQHTYGASKRIDMEHAGNGEEQQPPANKQTVPISVNPSAPLRSHRRSILVLWSETFLWLFSPPPPPRWILVAQGEMRRGHGQKSRCNRRKTGRCVCEKGREQKGNGGERATGERSTNAQPQIRWQMFSPELNGRGQLWLCRHTLKTGF